MSEDQLIGIIYSQLIEEFGFSYSEKDLWMIAENIAEKIVNQIPQLNDNQKIVLDYLKNNTATAPFSAVFNLLTKRESEWHNLSEISSSSYELDRKQQFQVLAAFAQWGLEQDEA